MKWLILILFPFNLEAQMMLKEGMYWNLRLNEPIVLDTGAFTFLGLEITTDDHRVALDARKAKSLQIINACFDGNGNDTAILSSHSVTIQNSMFYNFGNAVYYISKDSVPQRVCIHRNIFTDNLTAISLNGLASATLTNPINFTFSCNQFRLGCTQTQNGCANGPQRRGLVIGEGVRVNAPRENGLFQPNAIGWTNVFNTTTPLNGHPNANDWPVAFGTDRSVFPQNQNIQVGWSGPANWISLENHANNPTVLYRRYENEFVQNESINNPPIWANPTQSRVRTNGTIPVPGVNYENTCEGLITDPNPIFPGRIAVANDPVSVFNPVEKQHLGAWLAEAYPNPAQNSTKVKCFIPATEEMAIVQITDFGTGKVLYSKTIEERGKLEIDLDLSKFASGVYGYQVFLKNQKLGVKRFVVSK